MCQSLNLTLCEKCLKFMSLSNGIGDQRRDAVELAEARYKYLMMSARLGPGARDRA